MYILPFTFFGSLLRFREVSSTTFCIVENTLYVPFFRGTLGYSAAGEQEASFKSRPVYKPLASRLV